jgi:hypothetical protein
MVFILGFQCWLNIQKSFDIISHQRDANSTIMTPYWTTAEIKYVSINHKNGNDGEKLNLSYIAVGNELEAEGINLS